MAAIQAHRRAITAPVAAAATEIFKNAGFDLPATGNNATGWNVMGTASISGGALIINGNNDSTQSVAMVAGNRYRLSATLRSCSVGNALILTNSGQNGQINGSSATNILNPTHLFATLDFTATTNSELYYVRGQNSTDALLESISLTAL